MEYTFTDKNNNKISHISKENIRTIELNFYGDYGGNI